MLIFVADAVLFLWWYTTGVEIKAPSRLDYGTSKRNASENLFGSI